VIVTRSPRWARSTTAPPWLRRSRIDTSAMRPSITRGTSSRAQPTVRDVPFRRVTHVMTFEILRLHRWRRVPSRTARAEVSP
jgi:hypothetical protein